MTPDSRKVFGPAPSKWEDRRGTEWQNRGCSTSRRDLKGTSQDGARCGGHAMWKIVPGPAKLEAMEKATRGVRYACNDCKAKKYGKLPVEALA